jgi:hypothetical protein
MNRRRRRPPGCGCTPAYPPGSRAEPRHARHVQEQGPPTRYHIWTRLALVSLRRDRPKVSAAALPCPFSASRGRRLLGVFGLPLCRGLGPGKARCPLRAAKPDRVGRLPAVPPVIQPTPDRLRPKGPHLPRIKQAEPDGEAAGPLHARNQSALSAKARSNSARRASAASPGGTAEPASTPPSARNMRRSPSVIIPSYRLDPMRLVSWVQQWVA